ncbi:extracellular solute-binding protein family 5 [Sulfobacillus acidophilus TPY]|uniref:ABC-type transporter, periplasmic subunit n=1 Tax=Sulfobacillus acidophilus (strain ATCC 700253 / DSM 10332 / NAL) TaxID=679936 RepID=G8TX08_SULAD|nr:extracellular solute-binding protein family 5 [Sulfobacillus acidophilus TPY]AEW04916.1 ABC-type transporter, periplasmic subunit [Sulfobacillus acidophilus DSM 10332]
MKHRTMAVASAALLGSAALLAGCGGSSTTTASTGGTPVKGGTAVIALAPQTSPNWFFPILSAAAFSDVNTQVDSMMYRPLIMFNNQDQVDYARSLVSNISYNATGTRYVLTLSSKYKWSNGQPITAQDVVFTWNVMKAASGSNAPWTYGGAGIGGVPTRWTSVTANGSNQVIVTLNQASNPNWFIHNGLGQIWPVPASVWDKYPTNMNQELSFIQSVANSPMNAVYDVVDGAYHIQSFSPNNQWVFVPNPNFGGHKSILNKVIFQYETGDSAEFAGLKTGTINFGYLPPSEWGARNELTGDVLAPTYDLGFNYLIVNMNPHAPGGLGPYFNQLYVRQALEMGVDQPAIISAVFHGQAVPEGGPVASQPKTAFTDPSLDNPLYPYNPAAGKKLLEAHGWHEVNGVMEKNGVKLAFTFLAVSGDQAQTDLQQILKQDWAQEGIQVTIEQQPFDNVISTAQQSNATKWDMADWGGGWTYQPDYYPTGGGLFATGAASNFQGYSNPTMDQLIKASYLPGTPHQTLAALFKYEEFAAKNLPVIYLPWPAAGPAGAGALIEHATSLHGTVSTFNVITDMIFPNYWYFTK